jgi:hypothetical protein
MLKWVSSCQPYQPLEPRQQHTTHNNNQKIMKFNRSTAIRSSEVLLVPYSAHHVPQYHKWMSSSELRALTASDELTLEEEFANQESWREDPSKLTFISADATAWNAKSDSGGTTSKHDSGQEEVWGLVDDDSTVIRGDVNMFFHEDEEDEEGVLGEVNIMVAEPITRGRGFGKRVLFMFLWYVLIYRISLLEEYHGARAGKGPKLSGFVAKIDKDNLVSIKMFESVGFCRVREEANYFGEVELRLDVGLAGEKIEQYFKGDELKLLQYRLNAVG